MEQTSLDYKLGTIDTKIDQILAALPNMDRRQNATDRRVGVLENARWKTIGFISAISFGVTIVGVFFSKKLGL